MMAEIAFSCGMGIVIGLDGITAGRPGALRRSATGAAGRRVYITPARASYSGFQEEMVLLVMRGFAQKPTLRTQPKVKYRNIIPARRPTASPIRPIMTGTIAPPQIAAQRIPENEPWLSATEFSAREMVIGHMTDAHNPMSGKAT